LQAHLAAALPHLGERLAGTEPRWDKPLTIVCPAGGHLHRQDAPDDYRVGDRLAAYPAFHRRRARHRARLGGAGGRGDLAQPAADAYLAPVRRLAAKPIRLASAVAGLARNQAGRVLLLGAEAYLPGLTAAVVRHTRLPLAARHLTVPASRESPGAGLPMMDQDVS
jgi:hypothetical protein